MRTILSSTHEVAHYWANKVQSEGRASALFFRGDFIYSYGTHFCIARHLPNGVVAFTTRRYSVTTSAHIYRARGAAHHLQSVYCNDPSDSAAQNMAHARNAIRDALSASEKKGIRQATRDAHKAAALHAAEQANAYLAALPPAETAGTEPIDTSALEGVRAALVAAEDAAKRIHEEQQRARFADLQESLEKWRTGEIIARTGLSSLPPALRLNGDIIQTSHGAEIPVADACKLWGLVLTAIVEKREFTGIPRKLGVYTLSRIRADGSIVVGCHDIAFAELERMAIALGLETLTLA